ncbi:site-specific integrase, partial [Campylobacter fetus]|nr:site-specific integrase [Campylobacter fetus]
MIFNLTLNDVYYKYFDYIYIIVAKHTLEVDISYFNKHIKNNIGLRDIKDLTFLDLQLFCNN